MVDPEVEIILPAEAVKAPVIVKGAPKLSVPTDMLSAENAAVVFKIVVIVAAPDAVMAAFALKVPCIIAKVVQLSGAPRLTTEPTPACVTPPVTVIAFVVVFMVVMLAPVKAKVPPVTFKAAPKVMVLPVIVSTLVLKTPVVIILVPEPDVVVPLTVSWALIFKVTAVAVPIFKVVHAEVTSIVGCKPENTVVPILATSAAKGCPDDGDQLALVLHLPSPAPVQVYVAALACRANKPTKHTIRDSISFFNISRVKY